MSCVTALKQQAYETLYIKNGTDETKRPKRHVKTILSYIRGTHPDHTRVAGRRYRQAATSILAVAATSQSTIYVYEYIKISLHFPPVSA